MFLLLGSDLSSRVGELDSDLLGSLDDLSSDSGADIMCDLSTEGSVIHEEDIKILCVVDDKLLQPVGEEELSGIVTSVADLGHLLVSSKATTHAVVDTWVMKHVPLGLLQLSARRPP